MSIAHGSDESVPSAGVDRVALVVGVFRDHTRLTLTEVSRLTGIPRTSTLRMLERLVRLGWLRRMDGGYELGPSLAEIGALALYRASLDASVTSLLGELHHSTGHIVHMGVLDGRDVLYLHKVGGTSEHGIMTRVGSRVPARSSTIGKAILSAAGVAHPIRDRGVAFGSCPTGFSCIGARVGLLAGAEVGISVTAPSGDIRFDRRDAAPVRMAAAALGQYFSAVAPPGPR